MINEDFEKWAKGYSGFDGGKPKAKIWLCGIEWGGGSLKKVEDVKKLFEEDVSEIPIGYTDKMVPDGRKGYELNLDLPELNDDQKNKFQYNYKFLKVMATIKGKNFLENGSNSTKIKEILKEFNDEEQCFTENSNYLKLNLFPLHFKEVKEELWTKIYKEATGIDTKNEYKKWCLENGRFDLFKKMMDNGKPTLIITSGTSDFNSYRDAFGYKDSEFYTREFEDDKTKKIEYSYGADNTRLFVNIPFLGRPLNSNCLLIETGKIIKELLKDKKIDIEEKQE